MVSEKMDRSNFFLKTMARSHGGENCLAPRWGVKCRQPERAEDGGSRSMPEGGIPGETGTIGKEKDE